LVRPKLSRGVGKAAAVKELGCLFDMKYFIT
jgi:hypothetical protein